MPSKTHSTPPTIYSTKKEVHLSSRIWCSSYYELPFTNQVCLWMARLLIPKQAFTNSTACVGHGHSTAHAHSRTHTHLNTQTHTHTQPESAATKAPSHSNCTAHVVSCMTGSSIKGPSDFCNSCVKPPYRCDCHVSHICHILSFIYLIYFCILHSVTHFVLFRARSSSNQKHACSYPLRRTNHLNILVFGLWEETGAPRENAVRQTC